MKIHPHAVVHPSAQLGDGVEIGPFCTVGEHVVLKDRVRLISNVSIDGHTTVGEDCVLYPNVSIGHPPQDFKYQGEETTLVLGQRNILREGVTMHPGTGKGRGTTVVGDDCYFMCNTHVAHDCIVGNRVVFSNQAAAAGMVEIGDHVILGGYAGVHQYVRVGRHAFLGGMAKVVTDVIPYGSVNGNEAKLAGLNVIGLKRRGMPRTTIRDLRSAYRLLFAQEGTFQERISDAASLYGENEPVMEIVEFIRQAANRPICMPD
ncbi:acyl-ACP--UDP-N-acetylglucosamine O-acyltransferase [Maricaulis sp. D1M11]|uniref:acyl-ACP--UDP-N-acetylglucosamine O-acyltransferase n=1 Tax=Maricaulis sp. D1M11 TaxID=3076117 RepID=UPI0039B5CB76